MRFFCLLLSIFLISSPAHASELFTPEEASSILAYTNGVMKSQITGESSPAPPDAAKKRQLPCFVTFSVKRRVVACFGSFTPRTANLAEEIKTNVLMALKNDSRAAGLTVETAMNADLQITFPSNPQRINDWREISPATEGLLVERGDGEGVAIVPGEARTAEYAWKSATRRLGVSAGNTSLRLYRFKARFIRSANRQI